MQNFYQGNLIRVTATFRDIDRNLVDPTVVTARIEDPAGTETVYIYNSGPQIVRVSVGVYYVDVDLTAKGIWYYRFEGTGAVKAASQGSLNCIGEKP